MSGLLSSRAAAHPDRPFLIFGGKTWTWGAFADEVAALAAALSGNGVKRGDRVALVSANDDGALRLFFALAWLGAVFVPVNPDLGTSELAYILGHARVTAVVCAPAVRDAIAKACTGVNPAVWTLGELAQTAHHANGAPTSACDDVCVIVYTSGTTGFPKGVMHTQRSWVLAAEAFVERMHLQPDDRLLCVLPLFHINALFYSVGGAVAAGASLVLAPKFSASGFWRLAAESGATEVNIIAAIGNILARRPRSEFVAAHRLRKIYGAPITAEMAAVFQRDFGVPKLVEGYGMTEIPGVTNVPFNGPERFGSMGRAAVHPDPAQPFVQLRIVTDDGTDAADDEPGELWVRTPTLMKGYFDDPEQTAAAFSDGWFMTGDLVRRGADGFLHFIARKRDIIRKRGENIAGAELDRVLCEHPEVAEAAVIAVPAELGEDEILAALVLKPGAQTTADQIAAFCRSRLAAIKVPRFVAFVDRLPHTPTHRVAKAELKKDASVRARAVDLQPQETRP